MKILFISSFPPSKHNLGVPSSLNYYLIKNKPSYVKVIDLLYVEGFETMESQFKNDLYKIFRKVYKIKLRYSDIIFYKVLDFFKIKHAFYGSAYRCLPRKELKNKIIKKYDFIWIYPCVMYPWKQLVSPGQRCLITTPDCSLLHYELALKNYPKGTPIRSNLKKDPQIRNLDDLYNQSLFRENEIAHSNSIIHVVGIDDLKRYNTINPIKTDIFFSPHPVSDFKKKNNYFQNNKISVLISGTNHSIYNGDYIDRVIKVILQNSKELSEKISITFLGKHFEENILALQGENFDVEHLKWVDSYEDEIIKHDIHLFALQLGTGTKGKVLCSMASGLICVGNKYAFENIIVDDDLLINFTNENDIFDILKNITENKEYYVKNALKIQKQVIENHGSKKSAKIFWNKLKEFNL